MVGAEGFFADRQCPPVKRLRLGVLALLLIKQREIVEALSRIRMVRAQLPLGGLLKLLGNLHRLRIVTRAEEFHDSAVERCKVLLR